MDCICGCIQRLVRKIRRKGKVYLASFLTGEELIKSLCQPLQRELKRNDIDVEVHYGHGQNQWFGYCCSVRDQADRHELEKQSECSQLVLFFEKNKTLMELDNALYVQYHREGNGYTVQLMESKKERNVAFLSSLKCN